MMRSIYIYLLVSVAGRTGIHEIKTKGAEEGEGGLKRREGREGGGGRCFPIL